MKKVNVYAPFQKVDQEQRIVQGYASTEALDSQGEIVLKRAIAEALPDFMKFGNIREMHQPSAVGRAFQARMDDKGLWIEAKIVDDAAWTKVREGVYQGFSIGGRVTTRDEGDPKIVTGCDLSEISLVDRPSNPEARVVMFKADGMDAGPGGRNPLRKEGRRNSAVDQDMVQRMHDLSVGLGAACSDCPPMGEDGTGDQDARSASMISSDADMVSMVSPDVGGGTMEKLLQAVRHAEGRARNLDAECRSLLKRIERLERSPAPAKGVLRRMDKGTDLGLVSDHADPEDAHDLIKRALRQPRHF